MRRVGRGTRQKVIAGAAVAVLAAGAAIAAVSATGQSNDGKRAGHRFAGRSRARELSAAATYLGISPAQLSVELGSGKSLAQVANATAGKSQAGLVKALVAAWQRTPAAQSARSLSAAQRAEREQRMQRRVTRLVQRHFVPAPAQ